jgi:hypothetical protein
MAAKNKGTTTGGVDEGTRATETGPLTALMRALKDPISEGERRGRRLQQRRPRILYHYTTAQGFLSILRSGCLWATDVLYMNDSEELAHGTRVLVEAATWMLQDADGPVKTLLENFVSFVGTPAAGNLYTTSFSEDPDSLSQWRAYADDGAGYAVGFRIDETRLSVLGGEPVEGGDGWETTPNPWRVEYAEHAQQKHVIDVLQSVCTLIDAHKSAHSQLDAKWIFMHAGILSALLSPSLAVFKNSAFQEEREWRVVLKGPLDGESPAGLRVRSGRFGLTPYAELSLGDPLPIAEVVCGPKLHRNLAEHAVGVALYDAGLLPVTSLSDDSSRIKIRHSEATYR